MNLIIKSYSSAEIKKHPDEIDYNFTDGNLNMCTSDDKKVINNLYEFLSKIKHVDFTGTGEWDYLETKKRKSYINNLIENNLEGLYKDFPNFFRNEIGYGYFSPSYVDCLNKSILSQILCDIDTCIEFTDLSNYSQLYIERPIGNPYGICFDKNVIMPDTPRHFYYSYNISQLLCL